MEKIRAVILCASAMSSGLIVDKLKEVAASKNIDIFVECSASLRYRYYDFSKVDIVLLAPQVKSQLKDIINFINEKGFDIPVMTISMSDYGLVRGENILNQILDELK
ncbi:Predicted protein [[Clostridium] ultunense Esp]|uniref:PTS EIIB type-3 domain-containing protein n=1 Tax=[Clostridium] ultunense Esp TaxID=1288971 RepID=M1YXN8_9FIRM|nr:hypothetical protein [Schnuerera ultunensis]CCQ95330.1 Predicted protein [[Clostridium] ultunense Esp]SHD76277.1 conserved protein of unknown function [[Clostridium] ultunense Esp]